MEEYLASISVPAIAAAVYFVVKLIRHAVGKNEKFEKFVPLIAAGLGVIFAVVCFFALPAAIPAGNVIVAIVLGAASGFTAIGTDQMMKQFGKKTGAGESSGGEDETEDKIKDKNEDGSDDESGGEDKTVAEDETVKDGVGAEDKVGKQSEKGEK